MNTLLLMIVISQTDYRSFNDEPVTFNSVSLATATQTLATGEAAHTPMSEVVRVIGLLPKPEIGFVDFGCGYDARWCVAAAEK